MTTYKISGSTTHDADVHIIQNDTYFGKKSVSAGNYEVTIDSTTASGVMTVAKKADGYVKGYGSVEATTSSGIADLTAVVGGASIKNIQFASVHLDNMQGSNTTTISEVNMSNTFIINNGWRCSSQTNGIDVRAKLTDSTTLTVTRQEAGSWAGTIDMYVSIVEFNDESIAGVQRGDIQLSGVGTNTATINEVDTSKCVLSLLGTTGNATQEDILCCLYLTNSTTVTLQRTDNTGTTYGSFEILEFL